MPEFQVQRKAFPSGRIVNTPQQEEINLETDEVLVKVDHFAYTANNITYAVAGDMIGYWQFFPPHGEEGEEWGIIPVWGFANVISSNNEQIPVGDRLYGYFPPATHLKLKPSRVNPYTFVDASAHRVPLPAGYNLYYRVLAEKGYDKNFEAYRMLLGPLYLTAFCIWDALQDKEWYGAKQVLVLSASSKTSTGVGFALADDEAAPSCIGLTSTRNIEKVKALSLYDEVFTYDDLDQINPDIPTVIVDMSGNIKAINKLSEALGEQLKYCVQVGLTHWDQAGQRPNIEKDKTEFFFAPGHIQKRIKDWGYQGFEKNTKGFILKGAKRIAPWLKLEQVDGLEGLAAIHPDVCFNKVDADKGLIVKL